MNVKWKKVSAAQKVSKYEVRYRVAGSSDPWMMKAAGASKSSLVIKSLVKGLTYEVQVRCYKTVSKVKYYSEWSLVKVSKPIK